MAKSVYRNLTSQERERSRQARAVFEAQKDQIIAHGQRVFEQHERLRETVRALKAAREQQGVSLSELHRRTGITKASLSRLENDPNANPTVTTLSRIADALGLEIHVVLKPAA